eukprot:2599558-Prorocentrum_lima.AAC.1
MSFIPTTPLCTVARVAAGMTGLCGPTVAACVSRLTQEARHNTHHADRHNSKELLSRLTASFCGTCMGAGQ